MTPLARTPAKSRIKGCRAGDKDGKVIRSIGRGGVVEMYGWMDGWMGFCGRAAGVYVCGSGK